MSEESLFGEDSPTTPAAAAGHQPNISDLLREIYQLLTLFLSSRPIAELEESGMYGPNDPVRQFGAQERDLITRHLIAIAVTIRILDDRQSTVFDLFTDYCGTITKDLANPIQTNGLGLRDACNKIIHARDVEFDIGTTAQGVSYLHPFVYFSGTKGSKPWTASLDVVKFCRESAAAAKLLT
jgi:hypothetical protein